MPQVRINILENYREGKRDSWKWTDCWNGGGSRVYNSKEPRVSDTGGVGVPAATEEEEYAANEEGAAQEWLLSVAGAW